MIELKFNNKWSYGDFGLLIESYRIATPEKKKVLVEVPFSNGVIDVSGKLGKVNYTEREITVDFALVANSKADLKAKMTLINHWLLGEVSSSQLYLDDPAMYYIAEVRSKFEYDVFDRACRFTVVFIAQPYKVGHCYEGSKKEWDCFNFYEDVLQESIFKINNTTVSVKLNNVGVDVVPSVVVSGASVVLVINSKSYNFNVGTNKDFNLVLKKGINNITIKSTGNATVDIRWRKEQL